MSANNPGMNIYKRHRFLPQLISYAVWLYHRFSLSHRDVEELLAERGIQKCCSSATLSQGAFSRIQPA